MNESLQAAALDGDESTVRSLLAGAADVLSVDSNRWSSLHNAMLVTHPSALGVVNALLAARANVHARTKDGKTPLHLAHEADPKVDWKMISGADGAGRTAFLAPAIVQTLVAAHADPNAASVSGSTPLHEAASAGASSCVLALCHSRANLLAVDNEGRTPLQCVGVLATAAGSSEHFMRIREMLTPSLSVDGVAAEEQQDEDDPAADEAWSDALDALQQRMQRLRHSHGVDGQQQGWQQRDVQRQGIGSVARYKRQQSELEAGDDLSTQSAPIPHSALRRRKSSRHAFPQSSGTIWPVDASSDGTTDHTVHSSNTEQEVGQRTGLTSYIVDTLDFDEKE